MKMDQEKCCVVSCENPIDENYWNQQYASGTTKWDLGKVSPALQEYIDHLPSKNSSVLIPGCGNAYEAAYLLEQGFTDVTVIDIAPILVHTLQQKFVGVKEINIIQGDFFNHNQQYDLIIEQTFFCALPPFLRQRYVFQMHRLLKKDAILAGLMFDMAFEGGPPFAGSKTEYKRLFQDAFQFNKFSTCLHSDEKRAGSELFVELQKIENTVQLYAIDGVTCGNCSDTISKKLLALDGILNCSISTNFKELLLVSTKQIPLKALKAVLSYDEHYTIDLAN